MNAEPASVVPVPPSDPKTSPIMMRSGSLEVVYVHDDNLGFHAHYELRDADTLDDSGHAKLQVVRGHSHSQPSAASWWTPDVWDVVAALVPKPTKLRLPVDDLLRSLLDLRRLLTDKVFPGLELHFDAAFTTGIDFKRAQVGRGFASVELARFQMSVGLPRHVGVLTALYDERVLCEVLIDVTEVERAVRHPSVLAVVAPGVPADSRSGKWLDQACKIKQWPLLLAPGLV